MNAEASLGESLRELAAVVKLQCTAAQIPQRRQSTEHECSNAKQSEDEDLRSTGPVYTCTS